jgi:divalent metal cation (Fe/Co/Zn/Cd) transporter
MREEKMASEVIPRGQDLQHGLVIEAVTIAWMVIEAAMAIGVGVTARSGVAIAFGVDSLIELGSAGVLVWRLRAESEQRSRDEVKGIERKAGRIVGGALFALAAYVVFQSIAVLVWRVAPEPSRPGIVLAIAAMIGMPVLARVKAGVAESIGSPALKGDAACSMTCAYMAATLLGGLALNALFGWWWADPIAALGIVYFLAREGQESWNGDTCCNDACCAAGPS